VAAKIQVNEVVNDAILLKRAQKEISRLKQRLEDAVRIAKSSSTSSQAGGSGRESSASSRDGVRSRGSILEKVGSALPPSSEGSSRPPQHKSISSGTRQKKGAGDNLEQSLTEKELRR